MNRKRTILILFVVLVIVLVACVVKKCSDDNYNDIRQQEKEDSYVSKDDDEQTLQDIEYNGDTYEYNYDVTNILFLGVDNAGEVQEYEEGHAGQSDTLILLSMNAKTESTTMLEISRDSMVDVEVYDRNDKLLGKERMQIAAQFAYGDGKEKSCYRASKAASSLLWGVPIDSYIALNVDGIAEITEEIGGVEITVPEDYTYIEPEFKKGATLVLKGEAAERYVRYRDTSVTGSNQARMQRQTQFLEALALQLAGKDVAWYQKLQEEAGEYITTDLVVEEMESLVNYTMLEEAVLVPGEVREGEKHDEFIVDNEKLQEIIVKLFYKLKK